MSIEGSVNVHFNIVVEVPIVPSMAATDEVHAERIGCADAMLELKQLLGESKYYIPTLEIDEVFGGEFITPEEDAVVETDKVIYHGQLLDGHHIVTRNMEPFDPTPSQHVRNHSPDGFAWGYAGSGPSQLALAIMLDVTGSEDVALANYQDFKHQILTAFTRDTFILSNRTVQMWLAQRGANV